MKNNKKRFITGIILLLAFAVWTIFVRIFDVKPVGIQGTNIGLASINIWFHKLTGVHLPIYMATDWLGLVPIFICLTFGTVGLVQLMTFFKFEKGKQVITALSFGFSILAVLLLALTKEPYAVTVAFLLLLAKSVLLYKQAIIN